jgi:hypothetical protein
MMSGEKGMQESGEADEFKYDIFDILQEFL